MKTMSQWSPLDDRAIALARALAMDAVQKVGNGHPGTAMSLAPAAYALFQRHLVHDPSDPKWLGRDRFILSCGHSSMTLYTQLFFSGYGLTMKDLQEFRTHGSLTPGHPEYGHTDGVEMTTGPLGAGISTAVGFAMAARFERGLLDPAAPAGQSPFDHTIWVICSDGDLQEGVSAEASSLAGTQELGNLNVIYDDNRISIEGDTHLAFTEDVSARYRAYGWDVIEVATLADGNVDLPALDQAMTDAKNQSKKPTLIRMKSVIAWPAPKLRNTAKSHGSALGDAEIEATKTLLGLDPQEKFAMPDEVLTHIRLVKDRAAASRKEWNSRFDAWKKSHPAHAQLLTRLIAHDLPAGWETSLPTFEAGKDVSTRAASGKAVNAIAASLPEFWGVFSDYMRPSVRLAALMNIPTTFIWTHDSIGLGEDGPTHQPVEHLASLRAIPGLSVIRPADANEVSQAWKSILLRREPAGLLLSRQNLPVFARTSENSAALVDKGAYTLVRSPKTAEVVLIATGSEVSVAVASAEILNAQGISTSVVSAPCLEWFAQQSQQYKDQVIPASALRVSIEAGISMGWRDYVGDSGVIISLDHYGASASAGELFKEFGFSAENVVAKVLAARG